VVGPRGAIVAGSGCPLLDVRRGGSTFGGVEREVWRVEAAAGRSGTGGVYDLVRDVPALDPTTGAPVVAARWRLARALD
jgi:hypothetical protein